MEANFIWQRLCAFTAMIVCLLSAGPALADKKLPPRPSVGYDLQGEPMMERLRQRLLEDPDAVIETVETCKKYAPAFKDGSATKDTVDQLSNDMNTVVMRHWDREQLKRGEGMFYFRTYPEGYVPPKDERSLSCKAITGVQMPEGIEYITRPYYRKRMDQLRPKALARRSSPPEVVVVATANPPSDSDKPVDKKPAGVTDGALVPGKPPVAPKAPVFAAKAETANACMPGTFEVRGKTDEGMTLFVKPGATQWQLKSSCWAKEYETAAVEVILANKAEVTIPYCTAKPHTLPGVKDFDPKRWNMGKKDGMKIGDEANKAFVDDCSPDRLGYALQAGQKLFLPSKKALAEKQAQAAAAEAQVKADAEAAAAKQKAEAEAAVAKAAADADADAKRKADEQADAGVPAAIKPVASVEVSTDVVGLDGGSAGAALTPGSATPLPTASGPPPLP